jgi:hypothetical protein
MWEELESLDSSPFHFDHFQGDVLEVDPVAGMG